MGCSISVFFANAFLFYRTQELLKNPPAQLKYLGRYIDDLVGVWVGKAEDIKAIFSSVTDEHIKLTYVIGEKRLEALDLELSLPGNGKIKTKIFRKPTDGHQYVHWKSAHPIHLKKSVPFAQLLRIKRNCSSPIDYEAAASVLLDRFRQRGYPEKFLKLAKLRVESRSRSSLLAPRKSQATGKADDRMTFVTDFIDQSTAAVMKTSIRDMYTNLQRDPALAERATYYGDIIPRQPPRVAFRAGKRLGSTLGPIYKKGATTAPPPSNGQSDPVN